MSGNNAVTPRCTILQQTDQLSTYRDLANDDTIIGVTKTWDNSQSTFQVYPEFDRTNDVNCFIEWKTQLNRIVNEDYPNINLPDLNTKVTNIQRLINQYTNKITEIDNLKSSLYGLKDTRINYIDQEFEVERRMQKTLLDTYIKRARDDRLKIQDELDFKIEELKEEQEQKLIKKDTEHTLEIQTNIDSCEAAKSTLVEEHVEETTQKYNIINGLRKIIEANCAEKELEIKKLEEELETANALNVTKDGLLQDAYGTNNNVNLLYGYLKKDNERLETAVRRSHNTSIEKDIKNRINTDMNFINRIQASNRESFTNILEDNQNNFLLGLGVFSIGLFIYKMNK